MSNTKCSQRQLRGKVGKIADVSLENPEGLGFLDHLAAVAVDTPELREKLVAGARNTFKKDKCVNIRISGGDLERIRERASVEGIPYQTLISSVLHKFVHGRLVDRGV